MAPSRGRAWAESLFVPLAILTWAACVRLPYAGSVGEDEAFYALVAQRWLGGVAPYAGSFDVKPPGLFGVFALAQAAFGTSIGTIKAVEVAGAGLAAFGLYLLGVRFIARPVGWVAALLYPVYSLSMSGVNAPTELVKAPFEVFGVLAVLHALRGVEGAALVAGVLFGAAGCVKHTAAFAALACLGPLLAWAPRRISCLLQYVAGLAVVPLCFLAVFAASGNGRALLDGVLFGAAGRLGGDNVGFVEGMLRFFPGMEPLLPLLIACVLLLTRKERIAARGLGAVVTVVGSWFAGEAVGIVATRAMYDHYFLALLPASALLAGTALWLVLPARRTAARGGALLALLAFPVMLEPRGIAAGGDLAAARGAARALAQAGVRPGETTLVLDRGLIIDVVAGLQPASRYFHPQHLLCDFPAPDADPMLVALSARPRAVVVGAQSRGMVCGRKDRWAELRAALAEEYCLVRHVPGPSDAFDVYVRPVPDRASCPSQQADAALP